MAVLKWCQRAQFSTLGNNFYIQHCIHIFFFTRPDVHAKVSEFYSMLRGSNLGWNLSSSSATRAFCLDEVVAWNLPLPSHIVCSLIGWFCGTHTQLCRGELSVHRVERLSERKFETSVQYTACARSKTVFKCLLRYICAQYYLSACTIYFSALNIRLDVQVFSYLASRMWTPV